MKFFTRNDDAVATYKGWSRYVEVMGPNNMALDCTIFFDEEFSWPRFRIDSIVMGGFVIEVGGGPQSYVDFPNAGPSGTVLSKDVDEACDILLGRLQSSHFVAEYPEKTEWWNAPEVKDEDEDDSFKW